MDPVSAQRPRMLIWFSCGAASAAAAKLALAQRPDAEVLYCDTLAYEHPDNPRFLRDVEAWLGTAITILRSTEYRDIFDVFDRTGWLIGPAGARCSTELKKRVRFVYQRPDDIHVFGLTADEGGRIARFAQNNPELQCAWVLRDAGLAKTDCLRMVRDAGIALPVMYRLGYKNNNCIGCVKGGIGYWNKIRRDFPEAFARMAAQERKMGIAINTSRRGGTRVPLFLDAMDPTIGRYEEEPDISCGPQCLAGEGPP